MKIIFKISIVIWCLILAAFTDLRAQETEDKISTSEIVLTAEDFIKNNCESVGDALQTITGVYVNSIGEISLRDVSSSKVVVVLDGQRLNTAQGGGVNVSDMAIDNIEKIELLRGGRSAQYGADAVGGVIRITTLSQKISSKIVGLGVKTTFGSYNRQIYNLSNTINYKKISSYLSYQRDTWDGDFSYIDYYDNEKNLINNKQSSFNIFYKLSFAIDGNQQLNASSNYYKADNGASGMIDNLTPEAVLKYDNKSYNLSYDNKVIFKDYSLKTQVYFLDYEIKFDNPENPNIPPSDHDNYALGFELSQAGTLFSGANIIYGYSLRNDQIQSTEVGDKTRITHSGHTTLTYGKQLNSFINNIETALALRYDSPSDFENAISPRFSVTANHSGDFNLALLAHITKSYKAPSFNDLYWPKDAFAIGNPDLVPEKGDNYDIGLTSSIKDISLSANYFNNDVKNLILWAQDPAVNNLWTPHNISKTSTQGLETSLTLSFLDQMIMINGEYTYMKALDKGPDKNKYDRYIIYRPKNKFDLTGTFKYKTFEWNAIYHYVGLRYTNSVNTKWLEKFNTLDTNLTYRFKIKDISYNSTFEISNILDESFMRVLGTAEPGRMYKISFGVNI
ncbi:TonB-dependent receptor [bacterium]|nr:TonB-dependent receptor [bacterium]